MGQSGAMDGGGFLTWTVGVDECVNPAQSTLKGRFVRRADSIRPYNPCGKLRPFTKPFCCGAPGHGQMIVKGENGETEQA